MGLNYRKEAWKGTCSQPAKQRKPEDNTLKPKQKKQAHKRAKLNGKQQVAYTNYPNHSRYSAGRSTHINCEVIRTMKVEHCEEENLKPPEKLFDRQSSVVENPFIPFLP